MAHGQDARIEVHVGPAEREKLALPHPGRHSDRVEWTEPVASSRLKERDRLFRGERPELVADLCRRVDQRGDIAQDPARLDCPTERDPQDGVPVSDGGGGEALTGELRDHPLDVLRLQLRQLEMPDARRDVAPDRLSSRPSRWSSCRA